MRDRASLISVILMCVTAIGSGPASAHKVPLDAGLYSQYRVDGSGFIELIVCGKLNISHQGCYGSPTVGYFEHACAVLDGVPKTSWNKSKITRAIYVLDKRTSDSNPPILYVFKRTDSITELYDEVEVSLTQKISLPIGGGASAHCFAASNDTAVYLGTDVGPAVAVDKSTLGVTIVAQGHAVSITADDRGYVSLNTDQVSEVFSPAGLEIAGGGSLNYNLINTRNPWNPDQ